MNYQYQPPNWPVSFDEFKARRDQCKRRETLSSIVWMILFFTVLFVNLPISRWITEAGKEQPWIGTTYLVVFFAFLFLNAYGLVATTKKRLKSYGLVCPDCQKLLNPQLIAHVVTSGRCPHCGHLLVHDHPAAK